MNSHALSNPVETGDSRDSGDWAQEYRGVVAELDAKEREWRRVSDVLSKLVQRLSLLAGGHADEGGLQVQLDAIATAVHEDLDEEKLRRHLALLPLSVPPPVAPVVDAGQALPGNLTAAADDADAGGVDTALLETVCEWATAIVQRLEAATTDSDIFADLQPAFREISEPGLLEKALARLADRVMEHVIELCRERNAVQKLLEQVEMRLGDMQQFVGSSQASLRSALDNRETLARGVSVEVDAINGALHDGGDLDELRERVRNRLESVSTQFEHFKHEEEQRQQHDSDRISELSARIQDLEAETNSLRDKTRQTEEELARDELTRVSSRAAYSKRLAELHATWLESGASLSYAICDIDHFKQINDRFGHASGDLALKAFAQIGQGEATGLDMFARIGGEEFAMLMPDTPADAANVRMENIRETVERARFRANGEIVPITVSIGVTDFRKGDDPEKVYRRADEALYEAKQTGRNRVITR